MNTPLLDQINSPADLKKFKKEQLPLLVQELISFFITNIAQTGGHFASNLGVVELTVALHYVFDTPTDHLVWDVGHQAYFHKILTGRKEQINTIRQFKGLAPFPKRNESIFDTFGVGHSSTSISAALGMAVANKLDHLDNRSIAIIGDGAMTAGLAFEALNNAGDMQDTNLLVILNDNEMSISNNVGALPKYLARHVVKDIKEILKTFKYKTTPILKKIPLAINAAQHIESKVNNIITETKTVISLFNNFGFHYTGPVNGHHMMELVEILENLKQKKGPQLLHIITKKGHSYQPAELDPVGFHAIGKFDCAQPPTHAKINNTITYTHVFGEWIVEQATQDNRLIAITPAMKEGSGLNAFEKKFPTRYFDVGIAEQHAVTFAAGLACEGKKPVVAIYSTFLQRAYDQLIHDVCIQNLPVLFAIDRAGIVGEDGHTHTGAYDISFMRCIPNIVIATPSDENECRLLLSTCYQIDNPTAVRYPRGKGTGIQIDKTHLDTVPIGKGIIKKTGKNVVLLAFGSMVQTALEIGNIINATVVDMRFVKPIDEVLIIELSQNHNKLITLEENSIIGGAGSAVLETLSKHNIQIPSLIIGIPDIVTQHGHKDDVMRDLHLDFHHILEQVKNFIQ